MTLTKGPEEGGSRSKGRDHRTARQDAICFENTTEILLDLSLVAGTE